MIFFFSLFFLLARVEVYFSATDGCEDKIKSAIKSASKSVYIAVYTLTSREISEEIISASRRGIDVKVILDGEQAKDKFSKFEYLRKNGVDVRIADYTARKRRFLVPKMHHKFMIVDDKFVMTGSYNFTASAENLNDENCVFIYDDENVVKKFSEEFKRIWEISK